MCWPVIKHFKMVIWVIVEMILEKPEKKLTVWKCMLKQTHYNVVLATQARCRSKLGLSSSRERRQLWTSQGNDEYLFSAKQPNPRYGQSFYPQWCSQQWSQSLFEVALVSGVISRDLFFFCNFSVLRCAKNYAFFSELYQLTICLKLNCYIRHF